ncbi:GNAT family N-acetyltransferase [Candidatus Woesearchaeota archaeon]|nr:GNAT family N-acetyltransferase [Candidatus Woesearchaeota archaeon]
MNEEKEPNEILVSGLELALRPADERDIGFCYELMSHNMRDLFDRNTQEKWSRAKFRSGFRPDRITIVEHEGMSVGFYDYEIVEAKWIYVHNLHLSKDYQTGVGTKIIRLIEQAARDRSVKAVIAKVFAENSRIIKWLQRKGYNLGEKIEPENSYWVKKDLQEIQ